MTQYADPLSPYLMTKQTDPNLHSTSYTYDSKGNLKTVTDAQGNVTTMTYVEGYLLESIQRPEVTVNGTVTSYDPTVFDYDSNGNLVTITDILDGSPAVTTFVPGLDGRVLSITDRENQVTLFEYTAQSPGQNAGNLKKVKMPAGPNAAPQREVLYTYNQYDERIKVTDPAGTDVSFSEFDENGRLQRMTDAYGKDTVYGYLNGLLDYIDLPANQGSSTNSRRIQFFPDDAGRTLEVKSAVSISVAQTRVKREFDGRSNLKKLIRLKRDLSNNLLEKAHEFDFDILNRQTSALDPLGHESLTDYDPYCKNFKTKSARGIETFYSRDCLCRLTEVTSGNERREFHYDELSRLIKVVQVTNVQPRYDDPLDLPTDRPVSRYHRSRYAGVEVSEETIYSYDELDRLVQVTYPGNQTVAYDYDRLGRVVRVTDMLGNVTEYSYYNDGRLYQVAAKNASVGDQVFTYSYDLAGRPYEIAYPSSTGVVAKFYDASSNPGWDSNGRLTYMRYVKSGSLLQSFAYGYDDSGNRTSMVETPASGSAISWGYQYDWLDRLTSVYKDSVQQSIYGYDESDNRISLQMPVASETHTYKYDFADRITSRLLNSSPAETFSHDNDGNMLTRTSAGVTTTYTWDSFDKLKSIVKSAFSESYSYDAEGLRKSKGSDTRYFSSGAASLVDLKTANSSSFIQGDQLRGMRQGSNYYWYVSDGLGTVRLILDGTGASVGTYSSDEFGRQTAVSGSVEKPHTYTGGLGVRNEVGADSQLLYARQRWYDPQLGRWLSADPIGFKGGLNLYNYVGQNPTNFADPTGLETTIWTTGGQSFVAYSADQFNNYVSNAEPGSISYIRFRSHGGRYSFGINVDPENGKDSGGVAYDPLTGRITLQSPKNAKRNIDFIKLLKPKLAFGAHLEIRSCDTADGSINITQAISARLSAAVVTGQTGFLPTLQGWGKPATNDSIDLTWLSFHQTYVGGLPIW